jgi:RND family efflux transporter MFP subunit
MNALSHAPPSPTAAAAAAALPDWTRLALDLQAAALQQPRLGTAAQAAACRLAQRLGARRVSLAWADARGELRLLAASDGRGEPLAAAAAGRVAADGALLAVLGECLDQGRPVRWPPAPPPAPGPAGVAVAPPPVIAAAHRAWALQHGGGVLSLPLAGTDRVAGVIGLEWADGTAPDRLAGQALEHLAALLAPLLGLMAANERSWPRRLREDAAAWLRSDDRPERRRWRALLLPAVAVLVAPLLWPVAWHVGGPARLEGGVQRVLSAPADGFIQEVHARPGDRVRAGQPLVDLADRELQLERQRWQSQLAQQREGVAAAQARSDRAALAQHQARADEAQAQLELAEQKLQRSRLVAPFDAVVVQGDLSQQLGAPVRQGAELMTLAPQDRYRVVVEVDEHDIARVAPGQPGALALSALPWDTAAITVRRISPVARPAEGRNVFEVEAALAEPPPGLRPGLLGQARLEVGQAPLAWQGLSRLGASLRQGWWRWIG